MSPESTELQIVLALSFPYNLLNLDLALLGRLKTIAILHDY
jgi:hypothetical protein